MMIDVKKELEKMVSYLNKRAKECREYPTDFDDGLSEGMSSAADKISELLLKIEKEAS